MCSCAGLGDPEWGECRKNCVHAHIDEFTYDGSECQVDLKRQAGCQCQGDSVFSCNCEGTVLGEIEARWVTACYSLGAFGAVACIFLTGGPALIAAIIYVRFFRAKCFSCFAALLWIVFAAAGVGFLLIAYLFQFEGPVKDFLDNCEQRFPELVFDDNTVSQEIVDCGAKAFCDGITALSVDLFRLSLSAGIPFSFAGFLMFMLQYTCCCFCHKHLAQKMEIDLDDLD
mmetsp:Transcript_41692/g.65068  ORF Transcript_41692/g.65068 Transcript_41692/m.65068 type:complete len:228 (-) Transcript_41692:179-862(-)